MMLPDMAYGVINVATYAPSLMMLPDIVHH